MRTPIKRFLPEFRCFDSNMFSTDQKNKMVKKNVNNQSVISYYIVIKAFAKRRKILFDITV